MAGATFYNKKLLGHVEDDDFTDFQGIGSDRLCRRYESVLSVVRNSIDSKYQSFLACPYDEDGDIYWYVDEWDEIPRSFTELSGVEKEKYRQILDATIQHYKDALNRSEGESRQILNGALKYIDERFVYCYDNKVVLIAWGMRLESDKHVVNGSWLRRVKDLDGKTITFDLGKHGKVDVCCETRPYSNVIKRPKGYKLQEKDIPAVIVDEGYVFDGWNSDPIGAIVGENMVFSASYSEKAKPAVAPVSAIATPKTSAVVPPEPVKELIKVSFTSGPEGVLDGELNLEVPKGHVLSSSEIPSVVANQGYEFLQWSPSVSGPIVESTLFVAEYRQDLCSCFFDAGEHGSLEGNPCIQKPLGSSLLERDVPVVKARKGYKFTGWNISPLGALTGNRTCFAQYEKVLPWYKRLWLWLTGSGCLKIFLWLLIVALLVLLLVALLRGCDGCSNESSLASKKQNEKILTKDPVVDRGGKPVLPIDQIDKIDQVKDPEGNLRDDNGTAVSIIDSDGKLPAHTVVAPIINEDGSKSKIVKSPGKPGVVANRLNIFFEDADADMDLWVSKFKALYPSDDYKVIGSDPNVRLLQIQIPEDQRDEVRENLPAKIADIKFFVVDESIFDLVGKEARNENKKLRGWHLKATNLKNAWNITKGDSSVIVAVVDDGIDADHKMFRGRIYSAYNVYTQNRKLSPGAHGTHVAALAVGAEDYFKDGASGVAPKSRIMPVQVFDNDVCTLSSILSGIMYAIHHGADVVNVSLGPNLSDVSDFSLEKQKEIAEREFKNEELVFSHVLKVAREKNVILVFAVGNDNVLAAIEPELRFSEMSLNVAANTPEFKTANFSNKLNGTNITAPGVAIYSAAPNNSFSMMDGTSMAAPIVAGTVALMRSLNRNLTVDETIAILQKTGRSIEDNMVPPMVQIDKALAMLSNENAVAREWPPQPEGENRQRPPQSKDENVVGNVAPNDGICDLDERPAEEKSNSSKQTYDCADIRALLLRAQDSLKAKNVTEDQAQDLIKLKELEKVMGCK